MTEPVVEPLEAIDVQQKQTEFVSAAMGLRDGLEYAIVE